MSKKCEKCGAPITGFLSKISRLFGVTQSKNNPNLCNKCDEAPSAEPQATSVEPMVAPSDELMKEPAEEVMEKPADELTVSPKYQPDIKSDKTADNSETEDLEK